MWSGVPRVTPTARVDCCGGLQQHSPYGGSGGALVDDGIKRSLSAGVLDVGIDAESEEGSDEGQAAGGTGFAKASRLLWKRIVRAGC